MIGRVSDIDLRLLRVFMVVVEAGGFALATARLNVAESTISQHMADLEKRLSLRLCERGRSGFRLTPAGEEVYHAVTELMAGLDSFRTQVTGLARPGALRIVLGLPDAIVTMGGGHVSRALAGFQKQHPEVDLQLAIRSPRALERGVADEQLTCAIAPEHRRVAGLEYRPLFLEKNSLYCGAEHAFFDLAPSAISREMLDQAHRISRGYLEKFDADFFSNDTYAATVTETEGAAILILGGRLIGFLPDHYAEAWVKAGTMRAVDPDRLSFTVAFHLIQRRASMDGRVIADLCTAFGSDIAAGSPKPSHTN
jgi:LysR family transcriptional regulator, transcriptional activator for bauABCD operon